jgi:all-trans-retinol 13,14-reductase
MSGYWNLFILGYLPWLIVDALMGYLNPIVAVLISLVIIAPFTYKALKQQDYISLVFVSGFLAYVVSLLYHITIFTLYAKNILLIVGLSALGSVILGKPFTIVYAKATVSSDKWEHPIFIKINNIISSVWASIFLIEYLLTSINFPHYITINVLLVIIGFKFSNKFPDYYRKKIKTS